MTSLSAISLLLTLWWVPCCFFLVDIKSQWAIERLINNVQDGVLLLTIISAKNLKKQRTICSPFSSWKGQVNGLHWFSCGRSFTVRSSRKPKFVFLEWPSGVACVTYCRRRRNPTWFGKLLVKTFPFGIVQCSIDLSWSSSIPDRHYYFVSIRTFIESVFLDLGYLFTWNWNRKVPYC